MRFLILPLFALMGILAFAPPAKAADTDILLTVLARDGEFVGSPVGGAQVIIRDRRTGDIIANGTTAGDMGDRKVLMSGSHARDAALLSEGSARLEFTLDIMEPLPVTISATGPVGQLQSTVTTSMDTILIPGQDYSSGNGIMLELPGMSVDVLNPPANTVVPYSPDTPITVLANVMKLSGSEVEAGSPWPPERYTVAAHVYKDLLFITSAPMRYADAPGQFVANLKLPRAGTYRFVVTAFDAKTKEAGMDATTVTLTEPPGQSAAPAAAPAPAVPAPKK